MHDQAETVNILSAIAISRARKNTRNSIGKDLSEDYLKLVQESPRVTRNAFQRIYDMILSLRRRGVRRAQEEDHTLPFLPG